ncbi:WbqC family protein [Thalassotalea sp. M1531]|uniref:WbqC family protein n=1 Tax=Thalassotalea algicola TaxID=2716224 RepID=A0A7Y0LEW4_9GAMM|nr:WbqC family protein [Thalassotalea algicola]NMP32894.1 WbqC family protein [Thalassotalea algicola]
MLGAIMQPTYLPWCGYFDLIDSVDIFVFLDDVKLEKSSWQTRNRVKSANGEIMLTVPVSTPKGRMEAKINKTPISSHAPWRKKHLKTLVACYQKAPFFKEVFPFLEDLINQPESQLSSLNTKIIKAISHRLGINTEFVLSSELNEISGVKDERLVSICQQLGISHYLSPVGSADYLEKESPGGAVSKAGITLSYQSFTHPTYTQLYGDFDSHLAAIDLLFNCGFEQSIKLIRSGSDRGKLIS